MYIGQLLDCYAKLWQYGVEILNTFPIAKMKCLNLLNTSIPVYAVKLYKDDKQNE